MSNVEKPASNVEKPASPQNVQKPDKSVLAALEIAKRQACEDDLYFFLGEAWQWVEGGKPFKGGWHIRVMAEHLEELYYGRIKRCLINVPPRSTKSSLCSVVFPIWCWIKNPSLQFMTISHSEKLSKRDNVKARRLLQSEWFQKRWGDRIQLSDDQNTKERVDNMQGGYRVAFGVDSGIIGEGADILICDDFNNSQNLSELGLESALEVFTEILPTRFNDFKEGKMLVIQQRVHERDISGYILKNHNKEYAKLILPMEFEEDRRCETVPLKSTNGKNWIDPRKEEGELLMPSRVGTRELKSLKHSLGSQYTIAGQLQQRPAPAEGGMIKRSWFQPWKSEYQPKIDYIIQAWDTASTTKKQSAYSACITVGIFKDDHDVPSLILLGAWRKKVEFPELYKQVQRMGLDYRSTTEDRPVNRIFAPNLILIEEKSTGIPLIQTLNKTGLVLTPWRPDKYGDKVERVRKVTHILEAGRFYVPMRAPDFKKMKNYADVLVEQMIKFPNAESRDFVDCCLLGDTLIYVENGVKKISEIKLHDKVLTHNGRYMPVIATMIRKSSDLYKIKANTLNEICVTGNHPFLATKVNGHRTPIRINNKEDRKWVSVSDLLAWEKITTSRGKTERLRLKASLSHELNIPYGFWSNDTLINLENYSVIERYKPIYTIKNSKKYFRIGNSNMFPSECELTQEFGWALGFYVSEGCIGNNSTLSIVQAKHNKKYIDRFSKAIEGAFGWDVKNIRYFKDKRGEYYGVAVGIKPIINLFKSFGTLAENKTIPTWILNANHDFCRGFIQGMSDGDGWVDNRNGTVAITTASLNLAHQTRLLLMKLGFGSSLLTERKPPNAYRSKSGIYYRVSYKFDCNKSTPLFVDGYARFPLANKDAIDGEYDVYNISVAEDESYVTVGGTVHNCSMILQRVINSGWVLHPLENQARMDAEYERELAAPQEKGFY